MREFKQSIKKTKQVKVQYDLDRQTAKISALSSRNVDKYEFLTEKDVLPEKNLLKKAATIKVFKFKYLRLSSEFKNKTDIVKDQ